MDKDFKFDASTAVFETFCDASTTHEEDTQARTAKEQVLAFLMKRGAHMFDVRHFVSFLQGTVKGACNISISMIERGMLSALPLDREAPILVFADDAWRSGKAVKLLRGYGYLNLYDGVNWRFVRDALEAFVRESNKPVEEAL